MTAPTLRFPWGSAQAVPEPALPFPDVPRAPRRRGRRPRAARHCFFATEAAWLYHHLTITGPAAMTRAFGTAARGSGVIPWRFDTAAMEEHVFNLAASQAPNLRRLTIEGCRLMARQFRDRVEARAAKAIVLSETGPVCPFDLHVLLPVPDTILRLGPSAPESVAWLEKHWGTSGRLHRVAAQLEAKPGRRLHQDEACLGFGFFAWAATPHAAIAKIAASWPDLRLMLQTLPAD